MSTKINLREVSRAEREAYSRRIKHIIISHKQSLDKTAIEKTKGLIRDMQVLVIGRLHTEISVDKWSARWLPKIKASVDKVADDFTDKYKVVLGDLLPDAVKGGIKKVDDIHASITLNSGLPSVSLKEIETAAKYAPSLIRGYDEYAKEEIGSLLSRYIRTGQSPSDLMRVLRQNIDTRGTPFRSIAYRAELITRTESARVSYLGSQIRMKEFSEEYPDSGMNQQMIMSDDPCPECEEVFKSAEKGNGIWDVDDDDAPEMPIHPNCYCDLVPYFEGLSTKFRGDN